MGLLDGVLGNLSGSMEGGSDAQGGEGFAGMLEGLGAGAQAKGASLMSAAMSLVQEKGGLDGILDKFRQSGMAQQVESWISTGPNLGITAEQVHKVIDPETLKGIAARLGMSAEETGHSLAQMIPNLVNRLTPEGKVPENARDLIAEGLAKLKTWNA